jgi:hypothetical protein
MNAENADFFLFTLASGASACVMRKSAFFSVHKGVCTVEKFLSKSWRLSVSATLR